MARGKHDIRRGVGAPAIALAIAGVLVLSSAGAAYAVYRYDEARSHLIMPGISVTGVEVGGLGRTEAMEAVTAETDRQLAVPLTVSVAGRSWQVTRGSLGEDADVETAVDQAMSVGRGGGLWSRFWHRYRASPLGVDVEVDYAVTDDGSIRPFVEKMARKVAILPTNATITLGANGDLAFIKAKPGRKLAIEGAVDRVRSALDSDLDALRLRTRDVAPKVTRDTLGSTVVVRVDENRLYLYEGFEVVRSFSVATAKPGWTTPSGVWTIWDKREDPSWYNPALDSWGADLPAVVPGGPGNPMGTRAIYIDAPGLIRIHGTTDDSSIGRYASHGCIRMHNAEVEQLFELVPVGSHVIVVGSRPSWAQEWDTPGDADI